MSNIITKNADCQREVKYGDLFSPFRSHDNRVNRLKLLKAAEQCLNVKFGTGDVKDMSMKDASDILGLPVYI